MAIPKNAELTPNRIFAEYGIGQERFLPPETAGVLAPVGINPNPIISTIWDWQYTYSTTTSVAISPSNSLTITQQIPLTNVPPLTIPGTQSMVIHPVPWVQHTVTGLCLQSISATAIVAIGAAQFRGPANATAVFQGPATYTGFAVSETVILFNATSTTIGVNQNITLWADIQIFAQ
jgi:hypothetical protein